MRVGLVCPYSLTPPGGVQAQVLGLARSLRTLGHDARVLAPCDGPPPDAGVTPLGRSIPFSTNGSVAPLAPDPACARRTIRALREERFDVLHLHEPLVPGPTLTSLLVSDVASVGTFHRAGASAAYAMLRPVAKRVAARLTRRVAVSEDARSTAYDALGGEYQVLFNGIEIERYAKATPIPTDRPTILFVGRHEPRKGLAVLLAALSDLPDDVRVWVAGDGPQTASLRDTHAGDERIEWLGRISEEEKESRLRGAHVFCAPSLRGESFGVILLEAMAAGTPIVASDLPGYRRVARGEDEVGTDAEALLVPPGDAPALAAALRRALADNAVSARLAAAGELRAGDFSMDALAEQYVALYAEAIGAHQKK